LKDESKRRAYDLNYCPSPQTTPNHRSPPASTSQSEALRETAQIAALEKSKQERGARWWPRQSAFDCSIFVLRRDIQRLEKQIKGLDSIIAAEAAIEAQKNSWGAWLLSPIYKKAEESEEEKALRDRGRQERRIEKDMKERRLRLKKMDLMKEESLLRQSQAEVNAADLVDDGNIRVIHDRISARKARERQESERVENERMARIREQQQKERAKRDREAAEMWRKKREEERAVEQKQQEEQARNLQKIIDDNFRRYREQYAQSNLSGSFSTAEGSNRQAPTSTCRHNGWWSKVQGRTACPDCYETWNYLLQCPNCSRKACPRCQGAIRRGIPLNTARTNQRATQTFYDDDYYDDY